MASMLTTRGLIEVINNIDSALGPGYAARNPVVLAAMLNTVSTRGPSVRELVLTVLEESYPNYIHVKDIVAKCGRPAKSVSNRPIGRGGRGRQSRVRGREGMEADSTDVRINFRGLGGRLAARVNA